MTVAHLPDDSVPVARVSVARVSVAHVLVPDVVASLRPYVDAGVLGPTEVHLAAWVARASGVDDPLLALAVAMAAWAARHGHSCAALDELPAAVAHAAARPATARDDDDGSVSETMVSWPEPTRWASALRRLPDGIVRVVDAPDDPPVLDGRPLVLHGSRVYLQRHWVDECTIAASVRVRAGVVAERVSAGAGELLDELLPVTVGGEPNLQRQAADMVLATRLAVIAGGPGTGKTYSVARLLAVLTTDAHITGRPLRIALAAPTGKAAARLQESIRAALDQPTMRDRLSPDVAETLAALVPTTIHRLLGPLAEQRHRFRHHSGDPLPFDLVVVDETSMVSAPLLARLFEAIRPDARVVLLGDPDQLESVELGAVLGDLVAAADPISPSSGRSLAGNVARLLRGHRFGGGSPIALLADAVRRGDADAAVAVARTHDESLRWVEGDDPSSASIVATVEAVVSPLLRIVRLAAEEGRAADALAAAAQVRMLCAHRLGPFGVSVWNAHGERWLAAGVDRADSVVRGPGVLSGPGAAGARWYPGRPLLVTHNDVRLRLSNGDTGVVVREEGRLVAVFAAASGIVRYEPAQLADIETAAAMTVHKSQGSEYPTVVMVLPPVSSPLVGRELLYTGVTRAKDRLVLVGDEASLRRCIATPARRMTGLDGAVRR